MPHIFILIFALILFLFPSLNILGQDAGQKTQDLIAALGKTKYKKKEKKGFSFETYVDVKSEAVVKNNASEYSGVYESEDGGYCLELSISGNGVIEGTGYDFVFSGSRKQNFKLRNARVEGALLTATKVYSDGRTVDFEAVFNNRTIVSGTNPNEITSRETRYGLGFVTYGGFPDDAVMNRIFLEFKR